MSSDPCRAVIFTRTHLFSGDLLLADRRLSDLLNDKRESAISLAGGTLARLNHPADPLAEHLRFIVPKHQIAVAFEMEAAGHSSRRLYSFVRKSPHPVLITLDGLEIRGSVHTPGRLDALAVFEFMVAGDELFFPLTGAVIAFCDGANETISKDSIVVNRARVHSIALLGEEPHSRSALG